MREQGCIAGDRVLGPLRPDQLPEQIAQELRELAHIWPRPWPEAVDRAITEQRLFGSRSRIPPGPDRPWRSRDRG